MSRYPRPGTFADAIWETGTPYRTVNASVLVLATSRHKVTCTEDEALSKLRAEYGPTCEIERIGTWRTVTQEDIECGIATFFDDYERGDWLEDATGEAWVRVAYPLLDPDTYEPPNPSPAASSSLSPERPSET